jgi:hypothetical protein
VCRARQDAVWGVSKSRWKDTERTLTDFEALRTTSMVVGVEEVQPFEDEMKSNDRVIG